MYLNTIDYFIPDTRIETPEFVSRLQDGAIPSNFKSRETFTDYILNTLDVQSIAVFDGAAIDLVTTAFSEFLKRNAIDPGKVDLIIQAKDIKSPKDDVALYVKHAFGFSQADILNISGSQCANIESVIDFLSGTNLSRYENVLVYSFNHKSSLSERIIGSYAVEGDAVGMTLISKTETGICVIDSLKKINANLHNADTSTDYSLLHCKMYLETLKVFLARHQELPSTIGKLVLQKGNSELLEQCLGSKKFNKSVYYRSPGLQRAGHLDCIDFLASMKSLQDSGFQGSVASFGIGWKGVYILSLYQF